MNKVDKASKVLLAQLSLSEDKHKTFFQHHDSLALCYLEASLEKNGIYAQVFDCQQFPEEEKILWDKIRKQSYDFLAFSAHSQKGFKDIAKVLPRIKKLQISGKIILGGYFATLAHQEILDMIPEVDFILKGEGENSLWQLIDSHSRERAVDQVEGISFRLPNGEIFTNKPARIQDIDSLPFPKRSYLEHIQKEIETRSRYIGIITSRGCHQKCSFCSVSAFYFRTPKVRRSVENVIEEIDSLYHEWGVRKLKFYDESFLENTPEDKDWIDNFCEILIRDYPGLEYFAQFRSDIDDGNLIEKMVRSGMNEAYIGVESAAQNQLNRLGKRNTIEQNERCLNLLKKLGVKIYLGFIMFTPSSSLNEVKENIGWLEKMDCFRRDNLINKLNIYRGTPLFTHMKNHGNLKESSLSDTKNYTFDHPEVKRLVSLMDYVKAHFHPVMMKMDELENRLFALKNEDSSNMEEIVKFEQMVRKLRKKELNAWINILKSAIVFVEKQGARREIERLAQSYLTEISQDCIKVSKIIIR